LGRSEPKTLKKRLPQERTPKGRNAILFIAKRRLEPALLGSPRIAGSFYRGGGGIPGISKKVHRGALLVDEDATQRRGGVVFLEGPQNRCAVKDVFANPKKGGGIRRLAGEHLL